MALFWKAEILKHAKNQQAYIFLWLLERQDTVLQPMTSYGRAGQPFYKWGRKLCELWHTSQVPHGEEQGHLKWSWQDGAGLSLEAVSGAVPHIPAGSPSLYDGTTLNSPCQYGPVTRHVTETCHNTCTWLTCVSGAKKWSPWNLLFIYLESPYQSVKDFNSISLSVVVTWEYHCIYFYPRQRRKKNEKKAPFNEKEVYTVTQDPELQCSNGDLQKVKMRHHGGTDYAMSAYAGVHVTSSEAACPGCC